MGKFLIRNKLITKNADFFFPPAGCLNWSPCVPDGGVKNYLQFCQYLRRNALVPNWTLKNAKTNVCSPVLHLMPRMLDLSLLSESARYGLTRGGGEACRERQRTGLYGVKFVSFVASTFHSNYLLHALSATSWQRLPPLFSSPPPPPRINGDYLFHFVLTYLPLPPTPFLSQRPGVEAYCNDGQKVGTVDIAQTFNLINYCKFDYPWISK